MSCAIFIHLFGPSAKPTEGHTVCQKLLLASVKGAIIDSADPNDLLWGEGVEQPSSRQIFKWILNPGPFRQPRPSDVGTILKPIYRHMQL